MRRTASPLVESVEPLSERVFVNTPLTTNLKSRQIFAVDHSLQSAPGYLQQLSGFFDSEKFQRLSAVFHSHYHRSNPNAIATMGLVALFLDKAGVYRFRPRKFLRCEVVTRSIMEKRASTNRYRSQSNLAFSGQAHLIFWLMR